MGTALQSMAAGGLDLVEDRLKARGRHCWRSGRCRRSEDRRRTHDQSGEFPVPDGRKTELKKPSSGLFFFGCCRARETIDMGMAAKAKHNFKAIRCCPMDSSTDRQCNR